MNSVTVGMTVSSLDDRTVGVVTAVNSCCFCFKAEGDRREFTARWDGVFDVQHRTVSLIYVFREPHRYQCAAHPSPLVPVTSLRSIGWAVGPRRRSVGHVLRRAPDRQREAVHPAA